MGADINVRVLSRDTALVVAAKKYENEGIIEELVSLGVDPKAVNSKGETALDVAKKNGNRIAKKSKEQILTLSSSCHNLLLG